MRLVETPFLSVNKYGQRTSGYIDLLLETSKGGVIIDHKSFLGKRTDWPVKALSYSGQLAMPYRGARHTSAICVWSIGSAKREALSESTSYTIRAEESTTFTIDLIPLR